MLARQIGDKTQEVKAAGDLANCLKLCGCFEEAIVHFGSYFYLMDKNILFSQFVHSQWTLTNVKTEGDRFVTGIAHFHQANIFHTKVRLILISKNPMP